MPVKHTGWYQGQRMATGSSGVISAGTPQGVEAGLHMLDAGGNAYDAIVAAAFVAFVLEPSNCGLGGYGRLAGFVAGTREMVSVDHYLRAPAGVQDDMFEIDDTRPVKYYETPWTKGQKAEAGPLAAGVPGAVPGLWETHQRWGRLPWATLLEPAIAEAEAGLKVTWPILLAICEHHEILRRQRALADDLCPSGELPKIDGQFGGGTVLDRSDLAGTLKRIARHGPAGLHEGAVAEAIENAVVSQGGILTAADLAAYRPRVLIETPQHYRGLDYVSCFCPTTCEALNILETFDLADMAGDSAAFHHVMAEAHAIAFVDSIAHYGDPDFEDQPVDALSSSAFGRLRAGDISMEQALARPVAPVDPRDAEVVGHPTPRQTDPVSWAPRLGGTTQMAAADGEGNMAALCTSLSGSFGSMVLAPGTGVILNNGMQNFDPRPGRPNSLKPGKMPIFAAPVIVAARDGKAVFAATGSGGYRIMSGVLHTLVHWCDHNLPLGDAIAAPRSHSQGRDTFVDARLPAETIEQLAAMGHDVWVQQDIAGLNAFGRVCAVCREHGDSTLTAAAWPDWRCEVGAIGP